MLRGVGLLGGEFYEVAIMATSAAFGFAVAVAMMWRYTKDFLAYLDTSPDRYPPVPRTRLSWRPRKKRHSLNRSISLPAQGFQHRRLSGTHQIPGPLLH